MERAEVLELMTRLKLYGMRAAYDEVITTGVFGIDEFRQRANLMRRPPWPCANPKFPRPVCDADLSDLLAWLQQQGVHPLG
jgi:hypothetical protein